MCASGGQASLGWLATFGLRLDAPPANIRHNIEKDVWSWWIQGTNGDHAQGGYSTVQEAVDGAKAYAAVYGITFGSLAYESSEDDDFYQKADEIEECVHCEQVFDCEVETMTDDLAYGPVCSECAYEHGIEQPDPTADPAFPY